METIISKIMPIGYKSNFDGVRVIFADKCAKRFTRQDNALVAIDTDTIILHRGYLIGSCLRTNPTLQGYADEVIRKGASFDVSRLNALLTNASIDFEQTEYHIGDIYTDADGNELSCQSDGFNPDIKAIKFAANVQAVVDKYAILNVEDVLAL